MPQRHLCSCSIMLLAGSLAIVWYLCPEHRKSSVANLCERSLGDNVCASSLLIKASILSSGPTCAYRDVVGASLKIPHVNLVTSGCDPMAIPSSNVTAAEKALRRHVNTAEA